MMRVRNVNNNLRVNSLERLDFVKKELNYEIAEMALLAESIRHDSLPTWE
jgi:hypothetical protein